jgi:sensor c-di-GMP phosphodiesterase-like protein
MICFRLKVETLIIPFRLIPLFLCFNLVQSPINLSNQLKLKVVAEGIDKDAHTNVLRSLSCDYGQGFLFSPAVDATAATNLIAAQALMDVAVCK